MSRADSETIFRHKPIEPSNLAQWMFRVGPHETVCYLTVLFPNCSILCFATLIIIIEDDSVHSHFLAANSVARAVAYIYTSYFVHFRLVTVLTYQMIDYVSEMCRI